VRFTGTTPTVAAGWKQMKGVDCVTKLGSLLRIGEEVDDFGKHKALDKWSVAKCQAKCVKNKDVCKGFNYNNDLGECRYKKTLSHANTIKRSTHDCWIYDPDGIPITLHTGHILTRPTTTTTTTTTYGWLVKNQKECSSAQTRGVHIGDNFIRDDFRQDFDVASVDQCQRKCAQYVNCDGFNYDFGKGICRYKKGITTSGWRSSSTFNCYVYLKPTTSTTPQATQPTRTPSPSGSRTPTATVTTAPTPAPVAKTTLIANQRPTTTTTSPQGPQVVVQQTKNNGMSGGAIAGAVVGTILGVAALAGAIVAVMLILKGRKHADVDNVMTHNTGNLTVGITDAQL